MNICIIVYSRTGHTLSVAMKLKEKLSTAGHAVNLEQVEIAGPARLGATDVQLKTKPEIEPYDALVFGSPVQGGAMPPAMTSYLGQIASLQGKKVACLVTHLFPPGVGANQTLNQMKEICESKGAIVCGSDDVGWPRLGLKRRTADVVDHLGRLFWVCFI
ncbi:MAG: flavodoxin [Anaerolineae bacterium]|nr:flavodoxin [Anaerolineae bacterium]